MPESSLDLSSTCVSGARSEGFPASLRSEIIGPCGVSSGSPIQNTLPMPPNGGTGLRMRIQNRDALLAYLH